MFLALALATLVLLTRLISSVSSATWTEMAWKAWTSLAPSEEVRELRATRNKLMEVRKQRSITSSQDEFAKWARLDREHQRLKKELEERNVKVSAARQKLTTFVRATKWLLTSGARLFAQYHYRREPVVWLPAGMLPYRVEWFLAMPSAPTGSVSAATWVFAADTTIGAVMNLRKRALTQLRSTAKPAKVQ